MMNWHVRKYFRYQHFMAVHQGRQFAQSVWAAAFDSEFGHIKMTDLNAIKSPKLI